MTLDEHCAPVIRSFIESVHAYLKDHEGISHELRRFSLNGFKEYFISRLIPEEKAFAEPALTDAVNDLRRRIVDLQTMMYKKIYKDIGQYKEAHSDLSEKEAVKEYFFSNRWLGQERKTFGFRIEADYPDAYFNKLMVAEVARGLAEEISDAQEIARGLVQDEKRPAILQGDNFKDLFGKYVLEQALSWESSRPPSQQPPTGRHRRVTSSRFEGRDAHETAERVRKEASQSGWLGWKGKYAFIWWKCSKEESEKLIKDHRFPELRGDLHVDYKETPDKEYVELTIGREGKEGGDERGRYLGWMGITKPGPLMGVGHKDVPYFDIGEDEVVMLGAAYLQPFDLWALRWNGTNGWKFDWTTLYWKWDVRSSKGERKDPETGEVAGRVVDKAAAEELGYRFPCDTEETAQVIYKENASIGKKQKLVAQYVTKEGEADGKPIEGKISSDGRFVIENIKVRRPFTVATGGGNNRVVHKSGWPLDSPLELTPDQTVIANVILPIPPTGGKTEPELVVVPSWKYHAKGEPSRTPMKEPWGPRETKKVAADDIKIDLGFLIGNKSKGAIPESKLLFFLARQNGDDWEPYLPGETLSTPVELTARKRDGKVLATFDYDLNKPVLQTINPRLGTTKVWFKGHGEHLKLPSKHFPPGNYRIYCAVAVKERAGTVERPLLKRMVAHDDLSNEGFEDYNYAAFTVEGDLFTFKSLEPAEIYSGEGGKELTLTADGLDQATDIALPPHGGDPERPDGVPIERDKGNPWKKRTESAATIVVDGYHGDHPLDADSHDLYLKADTWHKVKENAFTVKEFIIIIGKATVDDTRQNIFPSDGKSHTVTLTGKNVGKLTDGHRLFFTITDKNGKKLSPESIGGVHTAKDDELSFNLSNPPAGTYSLTSEKKRVKPLKDAFTVAESSPAVEQPSQPEPHKAATKNEEPSEPSAPTTEEPVFNVPPTLTIGEELVITGKHLSSVGSDQLSFTLGTDTLDFKRIRRPQNELHRDYELRTEGLNTLVTVKSHPVEPGSVCIVNYYPDKSPVEVGRFTLVAPAGTLTLKPSTATQGDGEVTLTLKGTNAEQVTHADLICPKTGSRLETTFDATKRTLTFDTDKTETGEVPPAGTYILQYQLGKERQRVDRAFTLNAGVPEVKKVVPNELTGGMRPLTVRLKGKRLELIRVAAFQSEQHAVICQVKRDHSHVELITPMTLRDGTPLPMGKYTLVYGTDREHVQRLENAVTVKPPHKDRHGNDLVHPPTPEEHGEHATKTDRHHTTITVKSEAPEGLLLITATLHDKETGKARAVATDVAEAVLDKKRVKHEAEEDHAGLRWWFINHSGAEIPFLIYYGNAYREQPLELRVYQRPLAALPKTRDELIKLIDAGLELVGEFDVPAQQSGRPDLKDATPEELLENAPLPSEKEGAKLLEEFQWFKDRLAAEGKDHIGDKDTLRWHKEEEDAHYERAQKAIRKVAGLVHVMSREDKSLRKDFENVLHVLKAANRFRQGKDKKTWTPTLAKTKKRPFFEKIVRVGEAARRAQTK